MPMIKQPQCEWISQLEGLHLFHFDGAPCAQRVRFALAEKGLSRGREVRFDAHDNSACGGEDSAWVSRIVSLIRKDHMTPTYATIHPDLVVPALVDDGKLHLESMDIVRYVDQKYGGDPLLPIDDQARAEDVEMLTDLGKQLHRSIRFVTFRWGLGRLGKLNKKEEAQLRELVSERDDGEGLVAFYSKYDNGSINDAVYEHHLRELHQGFALLEQRLQSGQAFITGQTLTMADVIWAMKVLRLDECGYPFPQLFPAVFEWFQRIHARPAFQSGVLGKHRFLNSAFRAKARVENMLGIGLRKPALAMAVATG